jgi:hypothetical protein
MGGSSKGGSGAKSYDYFGTVAGVICWGPIDILEAVIVDGKTVVTGPIVLSSAATDLSLDPDQGKYLDAGGRLTIYRGSQTTADPALPGHPAYRGLAYIVAKHLLFGRERTTAPNLQVIVARRPVIDPSVVAADHTALLDDGRCNPVASIAELLTSPHGLGLPLETIDADSWLAASTWAAHSSRRDRIYVAGAMTSQAQARQHILSLLEMLDAALYWTAEGTLAMALIEPGVSSGASLTIDARHITERPRIDGGGWGEVPTSISVRYVDRDASWKEREAKADNLVALQMMGGVPNNRRIDRPHVILAEQAEAAAADAVRKTRAPSGQMEIDIRHPLAPDMHPGQKVLVDIDPEPGGVGLAQTCVIEEIVQRPTGSVGLKLRPDALAPGAQYAPTWIPSTPQAASCPPIDAAKTVVIPLPAGVWSTPSVAILAPRPRIDVVGFRVLFSVDDADYADLGSQPGFAPRASLTAAIDDTQGTAAISLPDGSTSPDAYIAGRYPGTETGAGADELLLVLMTLTAEGRVDIQGGEAILEICSIQSRTIIGEDTIYTIKRARLGSSPRSWPSGTPGWIVPKDSLQAFTHEGIRGMTKTGAVGHVRMVAYTVEAEDESVPLPHRTFRMPSSANLAPVITWVEPSGAVGTTGEDGAYTAEVSIQDGDGDLLEVSATLVSPSGDRTDYQVERLGGVASHVREISVQVDPGTYVLVVSARDRGNPLVTSSRVIYRPPTAGTAMAPPTFSPPGENGFIRPLTVTVTASAPADRVAYVLSSLGSAPPDGPGASTASGVLTRDLVLVSSRRIWARAGDGSTWSAWVYADFVVDPEPPHQGP